MPEKQRLVIIGSGMAAARLVEEVLARSGRDQFDIVVLGEEPHGSYNRILLSGVLAGTHRAGDTVTNAPSWYAENGVSLRTGKRVFRIDRPARRVHAAEMTPIAYDKLVLATGSVPIVPPLDGLAGEGGLKPGVFVFRTLDDCASILEYARPGRRAVVIGGGLLGLEAARGLLGRGLEVHVVHLMAHLMETQLDASAGVTLRRTMESLGVRVYTEKQTAAVLGEGQTTGVAFSDGTRMECDLLVIAAGVRPSTGLAKQAGLVTERGVVVRDDLSSLNDPDIYAIGDCIQHRARTYGLVAPAWEQAQVLADRLTGRNPSAAYNGSAVSTKLKIMGVDVAAMGEKEPSHPEDEVVLYSEPLRGIYKKLIIRRGRLAGAILLGDGLVAPQVFQAYERGAPVPDNRAELLFPFVSGGVSDGKPDDLSDLPDSARVCDCSGVSKGAVVAAIRGGKCDLPSVCSATRAGMGCGGCKPQLQGLLRLTLNGSAPAASAPLLATLARNAISIGATRISRGLPFASFCREAPCPASAPARNLGGAP